VGGIGSAVADAMLVAAALASSRHAATKRARSHA
jgi:hypothetical protein